MSHHSAIAEVHARVAEARHWLPEGNFHPIAAQRFRFTPLQAPLTANKRTSYQVNDLFLEYPISLQNICKNRCCV